jgi:hypothetical protein
MAATMACCAPRVPTSLFYSQCAASPSLRRPLNDWLSDHLVGQVGKVAFLDAACMEGLHDVLAHVFLAQPRGHVVRCPLRNIMFVENARGQLSGVGVHFTVLHGLWRVRSGDFGRAGGACCATSFFSSAHGRRACMTPSPSPSSSSARGHRREKRCGYAHI